jgi:hypothetical protein
MRDGAARLGESRVQEIRADRGDRRHAEAEHEERRHERAASHAGEADDGAHGEAGDGIREIDHGRASMPPMVGKAVMPGKYLFVLR